MDIMCLLNEAGIIVKDNDIDLSNIDWFWNLFTYFISSFLISLFHFSFDLIVSLIFLMHVYFLYMLLFIVKLTKSSWKHKN